eukprot:3939089-Rhodomonas_salina.1
MQRADPLSGLPLSPKLCCRTVNPDRTLPLNAAGQTRLLKRPKTGQTFLRFTNPVPFWQACKEVQQYPDVSEKSPPLGKCCGLHTLVPVPSDAGSTRMGGLFWNITALNDVFWGMDLELFEHLKTDLFLQALYCLTTSICSNQCELSDVESSRID